MSDLQFPGLYIGEAADLRPALPSLVRCGYYALVMAADVSESGTKYGRQYYDYNCGTLICRHPDAAYAGLPASCLWAVAFHPDLFEGCVQEKRAEEYTFFSYAPAEALHVSCEERRILTSCFDDLRRELRHGADRYTRAILTRHIIRLLDYTTRFYERQFITRNTANEALIREYEAFADRYLADGKWAIRGPLTAARCAERLRLSEAYFEDLLEQELGRTHHCHMQLRRIEIAKRKLRLSQEPLCQIVRELGFPSVQYFGFLFKKMTGLSPGEYKRIN
ncbi:helix-turn-helix domain-containing protein [Alistipes sp.]|jgi:AraC-like DNA-binding protein